MNATNSKQNDRPILFVDVDGVISLFGFARGEAPAGRFHSIDGIPHLISASAGERLRRLADRFELVWATGWEEKANEYLPHLLELGTPELPVLTFDGRVAAGVAHWKLEAIEEYAGERPAAWVDDNLDDSIDRWALDRSAPTLVVRTEPAVGLSEEHVERLLAWAGDVAAGTAGERRTRVAERQDDRSVETEGP